MITALLGAAALAAAPPQISLVASPARVQLAGAGTQVIRLANRGRSAVVVDVARAGFALTLRGRPRVVAPPRTAGWFAFAPRRVRIAAGATSTVTVRTRVPRGAGPGDHTALLLFATQPRPRAGLAVRMRLGVVVVLRVPGRLVHRLEPTRLRVLRRRHARTLVLTLANRGNVTETLPPGRLLVTVWRGGRLLGRFHPPARVLLPRTRGLVDLRYAGRGRGLVVVRVEVRAPASGERAVRRSYRVRL